MWAKTSQGPFCLEFGDKLVTEQVEELLKLGPRPMGETWYLHFGKCNPTIAAFKTSS